MQFESQLSQYRSAAPDAVDWILELDLNGRVGAGRAVLPPAGTRGAPAAGSGDPVQVAQARPRQYGARAVVRRRRTSRRATAAERLAGQPGRPAALPPAWLRLRRRRVWYRRGRIGNDWVSATALVSRRRAMSTPSGPGYTDFAERVGTDFALQLPDGDQVPLVLIECTAGNSHSFSLIFKAGPRAPREQALYQLSADGFGPEVLFLVPIALRPNDSDFPLEYQAIFNSMPGQWRVYLTLPITTHRLEEEVRWVLRTSARSACSRATSPRAAGRSAKASCWPSPENDTPVHPDRHHLRRRRPGNVRAARPAPAGSRAPRAPATRSARWAAPRR